MVQAPEEVRTSSRGVADAAHRPNPELSGKRRVLGKLLTAAESGVVSLHADFADALSV